MRRRTMNNPRPINDVRSEYPALFDRTEVNTAEINLFLFKVGSLLLLLYLLILVTSLEKLIYLCL